MPIASISTAEMPANQAERLSASRPQQEQHHGQHQHELDVVVVDRARREDAGVVERGRADDEEREYRLVAGHEAADAQKQIKGECIEREGPGDQGGGFARSLRAGDRRDHKNDGGDRRVDQPRPVHQKPAVDAHAVLMQVEPALACDQVADLDQPQQAVIVGGPGEALEAARPRRPRR